MEAGLNHPERRDDPPPEEIEQLTAEIRSHRSAEKRQRRKPKSSSARPTSVPEIRLQDLREDQRAAAKRL
jgi:hypothetical protein